MDANDTFNSMMSILPKDVGNIVQGVSILFLTSIDPNLRFLGVCDVLGQPVLRHVDPECHPVRHGYGLRTNLHEFPYQSLLHALHHLRS